MKNIDRLVIVSHVIHYQVDGVLSAYGPYAREVDVWADLFPRVTIAAPLRREKPPSDSLPFRRGNIEIIPIPERGGSILWDKLLQVLSLPAMVLGLCTAIRKAEAVFVRCPGNLGLLGVLLAPLLSRRRVAKYAGQWNDYPSEPWTYRLQRKILSSRWWNAPVTIYGEWPDQPKHIIPFFTSILEQDHLALAQKSASEKILHHPLRILFVGRLTLEKNVQVLLESLRILRGKGIAFECRVIGDGPMREALERQAAGIGLDPRRMLIGALPFEKVLENYAWADVLVLASNSEGWPKAIAEGMAFGLVCVGSGRGLVPQMLAEGRGLTVEPGDSLALAAALEKVARGEVDFPSVSRKAAAWGQQYSLDGLREALRELLTREWHLEGQELGEE